MARSRKLSDPAQCPMLSLWVPPEKAGKPIGVVATTFTLDTALFEEECLARFADVQSDPQRDGALYRIEREEKLASLRCAAVLADVHHCAGRRSLRWDLLVARPKSGVMHAKLSLLAWDAHVRIIIASANLTNDGYRRNQECVAALDFDDVFTDRALLDPLLDYLREIADLASGSAVARVHSLLKWVDGRLPKNHVAPSRGLQRHLILLGPGRKNYFEQLAEVLPAEPPEFGHVVSPFFDPELRDQGPEHALWHLMKKRGSAEIHFHVAGESVPEINTWRLEVPAHVLNATPSGRREVATRLRPIAVTGVPTDSGPERRPLHAKTLLLLHDKWLALIIGSSNFTSAGMGLTPYARNFEACAVYVMRAPASDRLRKILETRVFRGAAPINTTPATVFDPALDVDSTGESDELPLPSFFSEAVLDSSTVETYGLELHFDLPPPKGSWSVSLDHTVLLTSEQWQSQSMPTRLSCSLPNSGPPPSSLTVRHADGQAIADWPVNIVSAAVLPAPDGLQGLSLSALLELLSSARPLHESLRGWLRRQPDDDDSETESVIELIDPHEKVDTSGFMIKRVQRACWAIHALKDRLTQPVYSPSAMAWRIHGPVGAYAVLDAIEKQCAAELPDERIFLMCEFWREVCDAKINGVKVLEPDDESVKLMQSLADTLHQRLVAALPTATGSMRNYVLTAMQEASHVPA